MIWGLRLLYCNPMLLSCLNCNLQANMSSLFLCTFLMPRRSLGSLSRGVSQRLKVCKSRTPCFFHDAAWAACLLLLASVLFMFADTFYVRHSHLIRIAKSIHTHWVCQNLCYSVLISVPNSVLISQKVYGVCVRSLATLKRPHQGTTI